MNDDPQAHAEHPDDAVPNSPLQALRAGLGRINDLTQRDVDRLIANIRARTRTRDV